MMTLINDFEESWWNHWYVNTSWYKPYINDICTLWNEYQHCENYFDNYVYKRQFINEYISYVSSYLYSMNDHYHYLICKNEMKLPLFRGF